MADRRRSRRWRAVGDANERGRAVEADVGGGGPLRRTVARPLFAERTAPSRLDRGEYGLQIDGDPDRRRSPVARPDTRRDPGLRDRAEPNERRGPIRGRGPTDE